MIQNTISKFLNQKITQKRPPKNTKKMKNIYKKASNHILKKNSQKLRILV